MKKTRDMFNIRILILILIFISQISIAQTVQFRGIVLNELTDNPVPGANIRIYGTNLGTSADKNGHFTLVLGRLPATIVISSVGYDQAKYDILKKSADTIEVMLRPLTYELKEVEISSASYSALFKNKAYSVLDYELMGDQVVLLVFRNTVQRTGMVLLDRSGDTLAISDLPELPPAMLWKDFLSNVHYYAKTGVAYQCYYDPDRQTLDFIHPTSIDSLEKFVRPYLFRISGRLYFQEKVLNGFGTAIAYYSKDLGKRYIKNCMNDKKISEYLDDMKFYLRWNGAIGSYFFPEDNIESEERFNFSVSQGEGGGYGKNEARAHQFEFFNMIFPLVKLNEDTLAFFNFGNDLLELLDPDGKVISTAPISFHKGAAGANPLGKNDRTVNDGWRWGTKILVDDATHAMYAMFIRSGMVMIRKINPQTGKLNAPSIIPFPFPEKIKIYKDEAFFLCKEIGDNENWKLLKCRVQ